MLKVSACQSTSMAIFNAYIYLFDKMDICKGCFFLVLKFMISPLLLTLCTECCFMFIREKSNWNHYVFLFESFVFQQHISSHPSMYFVTAFMYCLLMSLWSILGIFTYLSVVEMLEPIMRPTAFTFILLESKF